MIQGQDGYHRSPLVEPALRVAMGVARVAQVYKQGCVGRLPCYVHGFTGRGGNQEGCLVGNFKVEPPGLFRGRGEHPHSKLVLRRFDLVC